VRVSQTSVVRHSACTCGVGGTAGWTRCIADGNTLPTIPEPGVRNPRHSKRCRKAPSLRRVWTERGCRKRRGARISRRAAGCLRSGCCRKDHLAIEGHLLTITGDLLCSKEIPSIKGDTLTAKESLLTTLARGSQKRLAPRRRQLRQVCGTPRETPRRAYAVGFFGTPPGMPRSRLGEGQNGVSAGGVAANLFFDRGTFWYPRPA